MPNWRAKVLISGGCRERHQEACDPIIGRRPAVGNAPRPKPDFSAGARFFRNEKSLFWGLPPLLSGAVQTQLAHARERRAAPTAERADHDGATEVCAAPLAVRVVVPAGQVVAHRHAGRSQHSERKAFSGCEARCATGPGHQGVIYRRTCATGVPAAGRHPAAVPPPPRANCGGRPHLRPAHPPPARGGRGDGIAWRGGAAYPTRDQGNALISRGILVKGVRRRRWAAMKARGAV